MVGCVALEVALARLGAALTTAEATERLIDEPTPAAEAVATIVLPPSTIGPAVANVVSNWAICANVSYAKKKKIRHIFFSHSNVIVYFDEEIGNYLGGS